VPGHWHRSVGTCEIGFHFKCRVAVLSGYLHYVCNLSSAHRPCTYCSYLVWFLTVFFTFCRDGCTRFWPCFVSNFTLICTAFHITIQLFKGRLYTVSPLFIYKLLYLHINQFILKLKGLSITCTVFYS
jgi:hypothetical protein